jgi:hypothetical protein
VCFHTIYQLCVFPPYLPVVCVSTQFTSCMCVSTQFTSCVCFHPIYQLCVFPPNLPDVCVFPPYLPVVSASILYTGCVCVCVCMSVFFHLIYRQSVFRSSASTKYWPPSTSWRLCQKFHITSDNWKDVTTIRIKCFNRGTQNYGLWQLILLIYSHQFKHEAYCVFNVDLTSHDVRHLIIFDRNKFRRTNKWSVYNTWISIKHYIGLW